MATPSRSRRDFAALEARRFQAARLFAKGESQGAVARALGVTPVTAHHWYHAWHANGRAGLKAAGRARRQRQRAWIVFEDESGVSQQPVVRRTWAPSGETPILIHTGGHWKRLSIAGALAFRWDGRRTRFFFHTRAGSYTDAALICFLRDLKRHFPRQRLLLIWDGLSGHTSRVMTAYLARQHAWLTVERLPGYAPDLNPVEQLWGNVKTRELANVCAPSLAALRPPLHAGFARVRRQPHLAFAFLRHAGLEF